MGINRRLMAGPVLIGDDSVVRVLGPDGEVIDTFHSKDLSRGGWGAVYERCVGLHYEDLGYQVTYRGATLGYLDQGVDLVASRGQETRFIQCKFKRSSLGPTQVEWLLCKASTFVSREAKGRNQFFELVVPSINQAFPQRKAKRERSEIKPNSALLRLLSYNNTQSQVKIVVTEYPLPVGTPRLER